MARKIQFRRGIAATWTSTNPTLAIGEFGLETDTGRGKVGTGVTAWVSLPYLDAGAVAHIADTVAAHTAGAIAFTPAGTIAATDLQAAVVEVATDAAAATATVAGDLSTLSSATSDALALKAALASPALTGTPTAPTAVTATSTTQLATTAFVQQERAAQVALDSSRYAARPCVWFSGATGNYVSTPDAASLDLTGDLTLVAELSPDDLTPAAAMVIGGKGTSSAIAYFVQLNTAGTLSFVYTTDGTTQVPRTSTVTVASAGYTDANASLFQVAATLDADNGASGHTVRFWHRATESDAWSALGDPVVTAGTLTLYTGTSVVEIGGRNSAASSPYGGKLRRFQVYSDIGASGVPGSTLVADWRGDVATSARYRDSTGKVWTYAGSAWATMAG